MSIEQIESEIRRLPPKDLAQFVTWFDAFLAGVPSLTDSDDLTEEEKNELRRRRDEILADPSSAQIMDANYFGRLKREVANAAAKDASAG